jgi:hypothetical protein
MSDEPKPKQEPIGHATIPPALRPFLVRTAPAEAHPHRKDAGMDAVLAKINDAIGEDVQEIDPDVGVGNASKYVGPAAVPDGARGKAFTAKVKIIERAAEGDRAAAKDGGANEADDEPTMEQEPPSSRGGLRLGGRTARLMAQAAAEKTAAEYAPPVAVPGAVSGSSSGGRARGRAIAVTMAALGIVVAVAVWIVSKGPREAGHAPVVSGAASGSTSSAPSVPAVDSSGTAVGAAPTAPLPPPPATGAVEVDAGATLAPTVSTSVTAPYKPKGAIVKAEDPYDAAAPLPAKTVDVVVPPAPAVTVAPAIAPRPLPTVPPASSSGRILGSDEG